MIIIPYYTDERQKSHGGFTSIYTHRKSDTLPISAYKSWGTFVASVEKILKEFGENYVINFV